MQRQSQIRIAGVTRATTVAIVSGAALVFPVAGRAARRSTSAAVQRGLAGLVAAKGGRPARSRRSTPAATRRF